MKGNKLWKIFSTVIVLIFTVTSVYLMIGSASSKSILIAYNAVKPDSASGFSKTLLFLQSYTQITGDTSLAIKKGMSEEDAEEIAKGETANNAGDGNTNASVDHSNFGTLSLSDQISELQKPDGGLNYTYYKKYLKTYTYDNHEFVYESQVSTGPWGSFVPKSKSMGKAGCFFYASAALVGAEKGKVYTVENLLTDLGATVSYDTSGVFVVNNSPIKDLSGSVDLLNKILSSSGCGKTAKDVSSINESKLANGTMYIIHAKGSVGSSTELYSTGGAGEHWTAVVGITKDGKYIVLCNGDRGAEIDSSNFSKLNHIYEVN